MITNDSKATLRNAFRKVCTNRANAIDRAHNCPCLYRRGDLYHWAVEAFNRGEEYFYYEPVDPTEPTGKLRLCEPKYAYVLTRNLTIHEYEVLFDVDDA